MTISLKQTFTVAVLALVCFMLALVYQAPSTAFGSTPRGGEYQGTTTTAGSFGPLVRVQAEPGALGSVVITGAAAGVINIYDATTTNVNLRTAQAATTTLLLATFPASAAAGTYTFDRSFYNGLYVETIGTMPTTTITYRQ